MVKILFVALVVLLGGIGWWFYTGDDPELTYPAYIGPIEDVTIAVSRLEATTLVRIAKEKGFFKEQGINAILTEQDLGRFSLEELFEGRADIATVAESPVVKNSFQRNDFSILGTIHVAPKNVKIIARRDAGIGVPRDFIGKRIGTTQGTVGDYFLSLFIDFAKIEQSSVERVYASPENLKKMLMEGEIDGFSLREPHVFLTQSVLGDNAVVFSEELAYFPTFNLVAKNDFIIEHQQLIQRMLIAIMQAEEYVEQYEQEAISIISRDLDLDASYLTATWAESIFDLSLDQEIILSMENQAKWNINNNFVEQSQVSNFLDFIYSDALKAVNPGAVSIVQ